MGAYVLLFGAFPYMPSGCTPIAMKTMIRSGKPEPLFAARKSLGLHLPVTVAATEFVRALLNRDASARPSAHSALMSSYMSDGENTARKQLQSLRPVLIGAVRSGAFRDRSCDESNYLDTYLNRLQMTLCGTSLNAINESKLTLA